MYIESIDADKFFGHISGAIEHLKFLEKKAKDHNHQLFIDDDCGHLQVVFVDHCPNCHDTGEIIVCGWCESSMPHSSCDDTFRKACNCFLGKYYSRKNKKSINLADKNSNPTIWDILFEGGSVEFCDGSRISRIVEEQNAAIIAEDPGGNAGGYPFTLEGLAKAMDDLQHTKILPKNA